MRIVKRKSFDTLDEGYAYMGRLSKRLRKNGAVGIHLKIDNFGGTPVIFTLKVSETRC